MDNYSADKEDLNTNYYPSLNNFSPETSEIPERSDYFEDVKNRNCCYKNLNYALGPKIYKINSNTFYFPKYYLLKFMILFFFLNCIIVPIVFYFNSLLDTFIIIMIPLSIIAGIVVSCVLFIEVFIVIESTTLTIIDKAICRKKRKSYFFTELEKIELINQTTFYLVKKNGEKEKLFSFAKIEIGKEHLLTP